MKVEERMDGWRKMSSWEKEEKLEKIFVKMRVSARRDEKKTKI